MASFKLVLQWLESSPNEWPATEKKLLEKVKEYCEFTVNIGPVPVIGKYLLCSVYCNSVKVVHRDNERSSLVDNGWRSE